MQSRWCRHLREVQGKVEKRASAESESLSSIAVTQRILVFIDYEFIQFIVVIQQILLDIHYIAVAQRTLVVLYYD